MAGKPRIRQFSQLWWIKRVIMRNQRRKRHAPTRKLADKDIQVFSSSEKIAVRLIKSRIMQMKSPYGLMAYASIFIQSGLEDLIIRCLYETKRFKLAGHCAESRDGLHWMERAGHYYYLAKDEKSLQRVVGELVKRKAIREAENMEELLERLKKG